MAASLLVFSAAAHGQTYPTKPVRLVVGNAPGGGADIAARTIALRLSTAWGQQVIVDNRPGAGGNVADEIVAKAVPDGHTLILCTVATHAIVPVLYKTHAYDHIRDFAPISLVGTSATVLVVHHSVPAKSVTEFITYAKANPGKITYGSAGVGTLLHLAMELFKSNTGISVIHAPYKGGSLAQADLIGGHLQAMFDTLPAHLPLLNAGRTRALGISTAQRHPRVPNLPTISESGVPGFEATLWFGVCAPAAVPKPILAKINGDMVKALNTPELRQRLDEQGIDPRPLTPDEFAAYMKSETIKWAKAVKESGASAE